MSSNTRMELVQQIKELLAHLCVLYTLIMLCDADICPPADAPADELSLCSKQTIITTTISVLPEPACTCRLTLSSNTHLSVLGRSDATSATCQNQAFVITDYSQTYSNRICDKDTCMEYGPISKKSVHILRYDNYGANHPNTFRIWLKAENAFILECGVPEVDEDDKGRLKMMAYSTTTFWTPSSSYRFTSTQHGASNNGPVTHSQALTNTPFIPSKPPTPSTPKTPPTPPTPPTQPTSPTLPTQPTPSTPKTPPTPPTPPTSATQPTSPTQPTEPTSPTPSTPSTPTNIPPSTPSTPTNIPPSTPTSVVPSGGGDVTSKDSRDSEQSTTKINLVNPVDVEQSRSMQEEFWEKMIKNRSFVIGISVGLSALLLLMIGTTVISCSMYRKKMTRLHKGSQRRILGSDNPSPSNKDQPDETGPSGRSDYGSVFHVTDEGSNDFHFTY